MKQHRYYEIDKSKLGEGYDAVHSDDAYEAAAESEAKRTTTSSGDGGDTLN